jgi:simple sugar transport system ATP-binding protein
LSEGGEASESRRGLWINDVSIESGRSALLREVTFGVSPGEIVGLAGVSGNGQRELIEALVGLQEISSGEIWLDGERIDAEPHRSVVSRGIAYIPDDRRNGGLVMGFTIAENLMLRERLGGDLCSGGFVRRGRMKRSAWVAMERYSIAAPGPDVKVGNLSGGNQQKVVLARELGRDPKVIIAAEPTRGLDFATTEYVHRQLRERRASGASVLVSSTNLDEILRLSDRIVVLYQRRIAGIVLREEATPYGVGSLMTGEGQPRLARDAVA